MTHKEIVKKCVVKPNVYDLDAYRYYREKFKAVELPMRRRVVRVGESRHHKYR